MVDVFQDGESSGDDNVVDCAEMLGIFREADAAGVGDDGDVEPERICKICINRWGRFGGLLSGYQKDCQDFVYSSHSAGVDLTNVDGAGDYELFEDYAVLAHLSGCDTNVQGFESVPDGFVA